jgi:hypothetical protein
MRSMIKLALTCATLLTTTTVMADTAPTSAVYFDFDSSFVSAGNTEQLGKLVAWSNLHPFSKIVLDGHTDSVGSNVYNVGLSSRRAQSVQTQLIAMGLPANRIYRGIYGENGTRRTSQGQDRRVAIWTTEAPLHELVVHSLILGTAVMWNGSRSAAEIDGPKTTPLASR